MLKSHKMSPVIHKIRSLLGREKTRLFRRLNLIRPDWNSSLPEEASFWENALRDPKNQWNEKEFAERTDPKLPLQDDLVELLADFQGETVRILDVGAGPLTRIGKKWDPKKIEIVATDPLADLYDRIMNECRIQPLVRTIKCEGEKLADLFPSSSFDLAYASNSLDHAYSPLEVIKQMLSVLKPGRSVYLWHFANCGLGERYQGLHQWNFCRKGQDLEINDGRKSLLLSSALGPKCLIKCWDDFAFNSPVVVTTILKKS